MRNIKINNMSISNTPIICPYCGKVHEANMKFCSETGQKLPSIKPNQQDVKNEIKKGCLNKWCSEFGKGISNTMKFCPQCGHKIVDFYGEHECVDLGLSVKWATLNVGAENIVEFGNSESYVTVDLIKSLIKKEHWGKGWRLPSKEEIEELLTLCTIKGRIKEVDGITFCGNVVIGSNNNEIFLISGKEIGEKCGYITSSKLNDDCDEDFYLMTISAGSLMKIETVRDVRYSISNLCIRLVVD